MVLLTGLAIVVVLLLLWALLARWHATATWTVINTDGTRVTYPGGVDDAKRAAYFAAYACGDAATVAKTGLCELTVIEKA